MHTLEYLLIALGFIFLISGTDDLFLDVVHLLTSPRPKKLTKEEWSEMDAKPERAIAILVPCWKEYDVLEAMVRTNLQRVRYLNYRLVLGVYPNDPETRGVAEALAGEFPGQVQVAVTDLPGPTSKAHCLNQAFKSLLLESSRGGWTPEIIGIHDAEDVIHPDSLTAINARMIGLDFVQVPIFALGTPLRSLVAGTYLDEFAENHLKDLPARDAIGMPIPSAGVGTFFTLESLFEAERKTGLIFNERSFTEDYELSYRMAQIGARQKFLLMRNREGKGLIATRGYFPNRLMASIRQKTRWVTGITLQALRAPERFSVGYYYARFRDRKGLVTHLVNLFGWFCTLFLLAVWVFGWKGYTDWEHPRLVTILLYSNFLLFCFRLAQRFRFTLELYGLAHAIVGLPRVLISNFINCLATLRSIVRYTRAERQNGIKKLVWEKTLHEYPTGKIVERESP